MINPILESISKIFEAASPNGNGAKPEPKPKPPVDPKPIKAPPRYKSTHELWAEDCVASVKVAALIKQLNEEIYEWTRGEETLNYRDQQMEFLQAVSDAVADKVYGGGEE